MAALNFYAKDVYGQGVQDTRTATVPDAADQNALVDDQDLAVRNQVHADPGASRNMMIGFFLVIGVIIFFSMGGK